MLEFQHAYRRHLPHVQPPGVMLFVTFRLVGSLPASIQAELSAEANRIKRELAQLKDSQEQARLAYLAHKRLFGRWDACLDSMTEGPHWLNIPEVAQIVVDSLHYFDGERYLLDCFCLMSNHTHFVCQPLEKEPGVYYALSSIMHSLKRYSAVEANKVLGRQGQFWQHESYDHIVRNDAELQRIRQYVLNNPVKAGLVDSPDEWPWSYSRWSIL